MAPDGRLIETNEPEPGPAPRLFVGRTDADVVCHVRRDVPDPLAAELRPAAARLPALPARRGDATVYAELEALLASHGEPAARWHGPAYAFAAPPRPPHPEVVELEPGRSHLGPVFGILRNGAVASRCHSARLTAEAAEAGVETDARYRGLGYAAAVVNSWRVAVERSGRVALYSTSYGNLSSQRVARRLGLHQYAETFALT